MPAIHLLIKGKVQGVFYRASAKNAAQALGLKGWIKNKSEGDVEAVATGSEEALRQFVDWCRKGPNGAIVTSVNLTKIEDTFFDDFHIVRK